QAECPSVAGKILSLWDVATELSRRLTRLFLRAATGRRPVHGADLRFRDDPHWKDLVLFYEYFHGDDGRGIGASHQTGWTGLVAKLLQQTGEYGMAVVSDAIPQPARARRAAAGSNKATASPRKG